MRDTNGNTPFFCQRALAEEVRRMTEGMLFENPEYGENGTGEELIPMKVYMQGLPVPAADGTLEEGAETIDFVGGEVETAVLGAPWCNVKIDSGETLPSGNQKLTFAVIFCNYCKDLKKNGHEAILNLIQRFYERFAKDPLLARRFVNSKHFAWQLEEQDTYPYFFGVIVTEFDIPGIEAEEGEIVW